MLTKGNVITFLHFSKKRRRN